MNIERISADEFMSSKWESSPIIVDLRTGAEISNEYIAGCFCLPVQTLSSEQLDEALSSNHSKSEAVYLLCQSGIRAEMAVKKLSSSGYNRFVIIEGGLNALKLAGMEIKSGQSKVISLERQVRIAAGAFTVLGVVLGSLVNPIYYTISAFVGLGLMFAGITNTCGMALALAKMPWNK